MDGNGEYRELPDALPAAAAGSTQRLAATDDSHFHDLPTASRNHGPDSTGFRTLAQRVCRVLHIRARMNCACFILYGSTNLEIGVRRVSPFAGRHRSLD